MKTASLLGEFFPLLSHVNQTQVFDTSTYCPKLNEVKDKSGVSRLVRRTCARPAWQGVILPHEPTKLSVSVISLFNRSSRRGVRTQTETLSQSRFKNDQGQTEACYYDYIICGRPLYVMSSRFWIC